MTADIIKSKLARPEVGTRLVTRPHLTAFLAQDRYGGITLITAPAGYGKTTLVASWLQTSHQTAAWLSLKEEDNDPASFCSHVVAAIRSVIPGFGRAINALMRPPVPPLEAAITEIVNEIAPRKRTITLVLDDYDIITNAVIHQALAFLIERQPQSLQLIVLSRSDPPFILSRLRSQTRLLHLTHDDLRFTLDEAKTFFNQTMNVSLEPERIEALLAQTEGWVTGLQLAALSLRHNNRHDSSIDIFTAHRTQVTQFIVREVLSHLPADILSFLSQTSILDRISAPLCDAVTGRTDSDAMLNQLEQRHLFLVPLDHDGIWFRYHHLFVDALRALLAKMTPAAEVRQLHSRAAAWQSRHRMITDSLRHAKEAQDIEQVASILDKHGEGWLAEGRITALGRWLREVPKSVILNFPNLSWLFAFGNYLGDGPDPAVVEPFLASAEQLTESADCQFAPSERQAIRGRLALLRGYQARYAGNIPQAIKLFNSSLQSIGTDELLGPSALLNLAICHMVTNNFSSAREILSPYAEINEAQPNYWVSASAFIGLARIKMAAGNLGAAIEICRCGLDQFRARGLDKLPVCSVLLMQLGEIAYIQNRLEESQTLLEQAIELSGGGGLRFFLGCSHALLAQTRAARGLTETLIWGQEDELKFLHTWGEAKNVIPPFGALIAKLWLIQSRYDEVAEWLDRRGIRYDAEPRPEQEPDYLILVRLLCIQKRFDNALALLERMLQSAENDKRYGAVIELRVLQALARQNNGNSKGATQTLQKALKLAAKEGYVRTFLDEGEPMRALLKKALMFGENADYIRRLLDAAAPNERVLQPNFAIPLSRKEELVASYLVTGLSNEEIAERMFLSLNTVKMHLRNLYRKLDVAKRYDAIQKIRESRSLD